MFLGKQQKVLIVVLMMNTILSFLHFSFVFQADREHPYSQGQLMDQEQGWRKQQYDEMGEGRVVEGLTGDKMVRVAGVTSDDPPDVGNRI